jgi:uncharacterized protein with NAD-binding domain and iron-sulfur cluster
MVFYVKFYFLQRYCRKVAPWLPLGSPLANVSEIIGYSLANYLLHGVRGYWQTYGNFLKELRQLLPTAHICQRVASPLPEGIDYPLEQLSWVLDNLLRLLLEGCPNYRERGNLFCNTYCMNNLSDEINIQEATDNFTVKSIRGSSPDYALSIHTKRSSS